jgi:hypothetical protein
VSCNFTLQARSSRQASCIGTQQLHYTLARSAVKGCEQRMSTSTCGFIGNMMMMMMMMMMNKHLFNSSAQQQRQQAEQHHMRYTTIQNT